MIWVVQTTDGVLVHKAPEKKVLTEDAARSSADERNRRAEVMGLKVRYEAVEKESA